MLNKVGPSKNGYQNHNAIFEIGVVEALLSNRESFEPKEPILERPKGLMSEAHRDKQLDPYHAPESSNRQRRGAAPAFWQCCANEQLYTTGKLYYIVPVA